MQDRACLCFMEIDKYTQLISYTPINSQAQQPSPQCGQLHLGVSQTRKKQSRFLHRAPITSNGVLLTSNYGTTVKSLHTETVSESISLITVSFKLLPRE